jgi:hypothetical protein
MQRRGARSARGLRVTAPCIRRMQLCAHGPRHLKQRTDAFTATPSPMQMTPTHPHPDSSAIQTPNTANQDA